MKLRNTPKGAARIVLLGYGAINQRVADILSERKANAHVVGVVVRRSSVRCTNLPTGSMAIYEPAQLLALAPDLVLEAAGREAVREWGPTALLSSRRLVVSSASALVDDALLRELTALARQSGSQLALSPGAIAGVDALSAAARLGMQKVSHRIVKPPTAWGIAGAHGRDSGGDPSPTVLFAGSAREAAERYPLNANVVAITALASLGLDQTRVELVSDPCATGNGHEISASGDFGNMTVRIENRPLRSNPKSSELAALALIRLIENEVADLVL